MGKEVTFISEDANEEVRFLGSVSGARLGGGSDKIGTIRIQEYSETFHVVRNKITKLTFDYHLTPIEMFKARKAIKTLHGSRGLLFGWDSWSDEENPKWVDEDFVFQTETGPITFYPGFVFEDHNDSETTVKDQTKARFVIEGDDLHFQSEKAKVEEALEIFLRIISFLEGRFTGWFYCDVNATGKSGKGFVSEIFKRVRVFEYQRNNHVDRHCGSYAELLPKIVDRYQKLLAPIKNQLGRAMIQMRIATRPDQPVDTELIYWHSSLDILVKCLLDVAGKEERPKGFSRKLVVACESKGIEWTDLFPYLKKEEIFSDDIKADFSITRFRNNMIHEGIYPSEEEVPEFMEENARACALVERMVMSILGLEYRGTPIGVFRMLH